MMLMFYDNRMGVPVTVPVCRLPPWAPQARWFAPSSSCGMTDIIDDLHTAPPGSPQSDSDSTRSSTISAYNPQGIESAGNYYATFRIQTSNQPITSAPATSPVLPSRKNTWELPVYEQNIKPEAVFECRWRGCGEIFISLDNLSSHVSSVHADVDKGLFYCGWEGCSRGDKGFNARYKMLVHVRTHTNEKPHKCSQCEKSFSRAENLKIHTRSHSGEKPYVCTVEGCNKAYSNSSDRFKHTRTHSVDKPYCCKFTGCQKRYTDPSSLRKHVKTYKHISTSPLPSNGLQKSHEFSLQHRIPQNFYEKPFSNVGSTQTGVDFVERNVKNVQRKYSFSENDLPVEDRYSNISNYRFKTPPAYLEYNTHDFEYLSSQEKYVLKSGLPVSDVSSGIETRDVIESSQFVVEPLNLERSWDEDIYENGVLNLEKKFKSESLMSDRPLDLSLRKKYL